MQGSSARVQLVGACAVRFGFNKVGACAGVFGVCAVRLARVQLGVERVQLGKIIKAHGPPLIG